MATPFNPLDLYPDYDPQQHIMIPLTRGQYTIIDSVDADLAEFKWYAQESKTTGGFYASRNIQLEDKRTIQHLHRFIVQRITGITPTRKQQTDHMNLNTLDNRRANIRIATISQNQHNKSRYKNNTSGYRGVSWHKSNGKWWAHVGLNGKQIIVGFFDDPLVAYVAYCKKALDLHGEFVSQEVRDFLAAHNG